MSADHRLECDGEERERITASGGEVGQLNTGGGTEIGPLRCWPGGLCLSRSIGDMDVGEFIVPVPYVKQVKLSTAGGRIIVLSDGVWDALSAEIAFDCCRGMPPDFAASQIVKEAVQVKGLRDDTTCIVIDVHTPEKPNPPLPPPKKQGKGVFTSMFRKKSTESSNDPQQPEKEFCERDVVEELFEEGSAMLSERCFNFSEIAALGWPFPLLRVLREEILVADKQLWKELMYDMQKYESLKAKSTAAEAVASVQKEGAFRSPSISKVAIERSVQHKKVQEQLRSGPLKVASAVADMVAAATARSVLREVNNGGLTPPLSAMSVPKLKGSNPPSVLDSLRRRQCFDSDEEN